jgi:RecB family exonuclease
MHAALEEIYKPSSTVGPPVDVEQILRRHWSADGYLDRKEAETYFIRGLEALRKYVKVTDPADRITIGTEVFISRVVRLDGTRVRLGCKIDRVEQRPDNVLDLLDYKTCASGKVPTKESLTTDLPTFIYYLLARIIYPSHPHIVVSQLNLLTLARVEVAYQDTDLAANKRALIDLVHEIETVHFAPRPSSACAWCPIRDTCPAFNSEVDLDDLI